MDTTTHEPEVGGTDDRRPPAPPQPLRRTLTVITAACVIATGALVALVVVTRRDTNDAHQVRVAATVFTDRVVASTDRFARSRLAIERADAHMTSAVAAIKPALWDEADTENTFGDDESHIADLLDAGNVDQALADMQSELPPEIAAIQAKVDVVATTVNRAHTTQNQLKEARNG
jgi:hypothetical protein